MTQELYAEQFMLNSQVSDQREAYLTAQLMAFNQAHTTLYTLELHEPLPVQLYLLDQVGALRGGLVGRTHAIAQWLEISLIWIDESVRQ